jgi:NAD dependent epimerase/dehydratase family enzyme
MATPVTAVLDETAPRGEGFLADLASAWEAEALRAEPKTRVVLARTTMVMSRKLGALGRLLPLLRLGVGGPLGSGKQWWAFISLPDEAAAIIHLINKTDASGPYNLTAPEAATCTDLVKALGAALKRPNSSEGSRFRTSTRFWRRCRRATALQPKNDSDQAARDRLQSLNARP